MAQQQTRRENTTDNDNKAPKITGHFESITVKDSGHQPAAHHVTGTMHGAAGGVQRKGEEKDQSKGPSLEQISKYRGAAQQNSMDAIRAAEQQYQKSKGPRAKDDTSGKGGQTGQQAKERLSGVTQTAAENAARVSDYTVMKSQQAKESLSCAAQTAMQKAAVAKDVVAEKAVGAKDVALESGKASAGYVGKVAGVVKDKAVVAGWSAAEFASEKAAGATETLANVGSGVAGFAGNMVVATKDVLADVGRKTKDTVVATEESARDYAARKRAEKERELETKNSKGQVERVGDGQGGSFEHQEGCGFVEEGGFEHSGGRGGVTVGGGGFEHGGSGGSTAAGAKGIMRVIGETLVEIGQNTKDMLVGRDGREGQRESR